jgi:integrase
MSLTKREFERLKPRGKGYYVPDGGNLYFYVTTTGSVTASYKYRLNGRQDRITFGAVSLEVARMLASDARDLVAQGIDPKTAAQQVKAQKLSLGEFVEGRFTEWARTHQQSPQSTLAMLKDQFGHLYKRPLGSFSFDDFDQWRNKARLKNGAKPKADTLNRYTTAIRKVFSYAMDLKLIDEHPMAGFKKLKRDADYTPRWLSENEEKALFKAIVERDRLRQKPEVKEWLELSDLAEKLVEKGDSEGLHELPLDQLTAAPCLFVDYLHPIAALTLAAGLRRREVLNLKWTDLSQEDLATGAVLTIRAATAKGRRERYVPINTFTLLQLRHWRHHPWCGQTYMFPNPTTLRRSGVERPMKDIDTSWANLVSQAAEIEPSIAGIGIRALRATFGSKLVQAGVSIFQVSELMGHADVEVTKRHYAVLTLDDAKRAIRTVDPFAAIKDGLTKAPLDSNVVPLRKVTS